ASSSSTYAALLGDNTARHPGPSAVTGAVLIRTRGVRQLVLRRWYPLHPFLDPRGHQRACTGKRPVP
ncbi:hypothetical protein M9458_054771, partial [Cirrhinus mrigala]